MPTFLFFARDTTASDRFSFAVLPEGALVRSTALLEVVELRPLPLRGCCDITCCEVLRFDVSLGPSAADVDALDI